MSRNQRIKLVLTLLWVLFLAAVTVFTVVMIRDLNRDIEEIADQPGSSGVDFLGAGIAKIAVYYFAFALAIASMDIYISLRYFLLNPKRKRVWDIVNGISMLLSVMSILSAALIFVCDTDFQLFGLFWSPICVLFRLIHGMFALKNRVEKYDEIEVTGN